MSLEFWYMFPIGIAIATIAMASGVEGATFFTPLFLLGLKLPTAVAIGTGLITEVFGFSSGLYAYIKKGLIDYQLGRMLLLFSIPSALIGTWVAGFIPSDILKTILSIGLLVIATSFLRSPEEKTVELLDQQNTDFEKKEPETCLTTNTGETFCYTISDRAEGRLLISIGGLFIGMISTGLGQLNGFFLIQRCHIPSKVAVATSVFIVAITALIASVGHVFQFIQAGGETLNTVSNLVIFTVPGVLIGAQLGSSIANRLSQKLLEKSMGVLFIFVGCLILGEVIIRNQDHLTNIVSTSF
ncbi:sulfite exporter TauE/SafE family protein [Euhalothece natronophila Z-M001]|uniref:Probable membrane transporter protein n=1 Tax=Euhalothece natronophila Z-M001 TaxID=522448 RepID=A0A5B8NKJ5_9CHRO|nr:sulfite exporter TauE/SafE family protein [Euhalothece natronophila]QDZ39853.1 sulfite exporter TauE/SafE family protein [Euhalothece natronophila Z-M001]